MSTRKKATESKAVLGRKIINHEQAHTLARTILHNLNGSQSRFL